MATETQSANPEPPEQLQNLSADAYTARIVKQKVWRRANVKNKHFMGVVVGREGLPGRFAWCTDLGR